MNYANNNIQAVNKKLIEILDKKKYQVDPFQREYKWQTEHVEELIVDLERAFYSNFDVDHNKQDASNYPIYYMGPVVLYEKDAINHLIDGQQRLTSLTLILIYLNNLQKSILPKDDWDEFDTLIISKVLHEKTFNLEIADRIPVLKKLYNSIFDFVEADYNNNDSCRNIIERYNDIVSFFPPRLGHSDVLPLFIFWIQHNLVFTEIRTYNDENAYTIFETMNDRGLQLTPTEMLKSYLLMKVGDEERITELDILWKSKVVELRKYDRVEEDLNFFKAWLRAKYAKSQEKGDSDFDKIGNRFHYWVKENDRLLGIKTKDDYYFFIKTDFQFYVNLYLIIKARQKNIHNEEHVLHLSTFKGVSSSLSIPLILSTINVADNDEIIDEKIDFVANFLDIYAVFRLLNGESIVQSSIDYTFYNLVLDLRNAELSKIKSVLIEIIKKLSSAFKSTDYLRFDSGYAKYILSRMYKFYHNSVPFEDIYFQRKKESLVLYQFLKASDTDVILDKIPVKLRDFFNESMVSYCLVPKSHVQNYDKDNFADRLTLLSRNGYLPELEQNLVLTAESVRQLFIDRNKSLKDMINKIWILK